MTTFLIIIASIIGVGFLAYLIVNFIPRKLKPIISILLWAAIAFLVYLIYHSIMDPILFNKQKVKRYSKVIENLKIVRDAELAHREVTGKFTADKDALIKFIDTAKFAITEVKNVVVQEKVGALTIDREKRVVDTLGFEPVKNNFKDRNYKDMFNVPGTNAQFELEVNTIEKVQGIKAPVFQAKVDKAIVLEGLDKDLIRQEKESLGGINVPGEHISVGSLDDVKTGGNWPPSYDSKEEREANE
ncbi:MAG: hypothetical protein CSA39_07015 [Flavobacteriales bacterium]|nr:MAG: hypothetical protein CR985_03750 [Flavobacteriales bacterium]PIE48597.1 MAG: hypothetical protein CSA39_07015 [Flavobacteriales bacterium]